MSGYVRYIKSNSGFTLVELMTGLMLAVILFSALFGVLATSVVSWRSGSSRGEVQQTARYAMDVMAREMKLANSVTINNASKITIVTSQYVVTGASPDTITYFLDTTANSYILRRSKTGSDGKSGGAQPVTGESINSISINNLTFTDLTPSGSSGKYIEITLQAQDVSTGAPYTIETVVKTPLFP